MGLILKSSSTTFLLLAVTALTAAAAAPPAPTPPFAGADTFLRQRCLACHTGRTASGNLDLSVLSFEPADADNAAKWAKVHDRVAAGEMPPPGMPRDGTPQFAGSLAAALTRFEQSVAREQGRSGLRRLNAYEYENAVRDLLGIPWVQIKDRLPQDGVAYRFNKSGAALDVSHIQLARYMSTAEYALHEAMISQLLQPPSSVTRIYARQEPSLVRNFSPREGNTRTDRHNFPVLDSHAQPDVRAGRSPKSSPETREREAVGRVSSIFSDAGAFSWSTYRVPVAGRYKIRVKGYTIWVSGGGVSHWNFQGFGDQKVALLYAPVWYRPNVDEVWPGRRNEPIGVYAQSTGQSRPVGAFDFTPQPSVNEVEVLLAANEVIQTDAMRFFRTRVNGSETEYINPLAQKDGMPGVAFQWIEVEGPLPDPATGAGYRKLFGNLPLRRLEKNEPSTTPSVTLQVPAPPPAATDDAAPPRMRFGPRTEDVRVDVVSTHPREDAERLITAFLARAARRPITPAQRAPFLALFQREFDQGRGFARSLISVYTAILSSPEFLYIREEPGRLTPHALATRLALFLWNSEPDEELRALAASGQLAKPQILQAQAERLLNHPKASRFVEAFTDYWLDLYKINDSSPSTTLYNDYELDDPLKLAAVDETRLFVAELVRRNLPSRSIIDTDFTFLNERLARHYGIAGVDGATMRRVSLPSGSVRGGLLTQASILKVTANGTTTSPVLRGVWIMERILGFQTAPPPSVPAVEPDIRGAVTIRQQLERHRADRSCASCHRKIDPPGFALESFDIMGGWRDRYRAVSPDAKPEPGIGLSGQPFAFHYALPVDPSGTLPNGAPYRDIREFKRLLLDQEELTVARNLVRQLVTYATGAPPGFSDRPAVAAILDHARRSGYGVRDIIQGIIGSDLFQCK